MIIISCFFSLKNKKEELKKAEIYYEVIPIVKGDTIWSIASEYKIKDRNIKDYVSEIMEFNNMHSPYIKAGQQIIIPVWKE